MKSIKTNSIERAVKQAEPVLVKIREAESGIQQGRQNLERIATQVVKALADIVETDLVGAAGIREYARSTLERLAR